MRAYVCAFDRCTPISVDVRKNSDWRLQHKNSYHSSPSTEKLKMMSKENNRNWMRVLQIYEAFCGKQCHTYFVIHSTRSVYKGAYVHGVRQMALSGSQPTRPPANQYQAVGIKHAFVKWKRGFWTCECFEDFCMCTYRML